MFKEAKLFFYFIFIISVFFFIIKYYTSNDHIKKNYRLKKDLTEKILLDSNNLFILESDTVNIIDDGENLSTQNIKKRFFWNLLINDTK
tara:strand:+ start:645 stop:911 length:267 start_codon:yes stop_codon:yes gene_type:complete